MISFISRCWGGEEHDWCLWDVWGPFQIYNKEQTCSMFLAGDVLCWGIRAELAGHFPAQPRQHFAVRSASSACSHSFSHDIKVPFLFLILLRVKFPKSTTLPHPAQQTNPCWHAGELAPACMTMETVTQLARSHARPWEGRSHCALSA